MGKVTRRGFVATVAGSGMGLSVACGHRAAQRQPLGRSVSPESTAWKAGLAKVSITPGRAVWMTGYGARTKPSEGVLHELHAKALALEDQRGSRAVLVTTDLLGFPAVVAKNIADQAREKYGLSRDRLMLTSTHTHGGPAVASPTHFLYGARTTPQQRRDVEEYTRELEQKVVAVIGAALKDVGPARLGFGHGQAKFAMNRRQKTEKGYSIGVNPEGPVDHDVPFVRVDSEKGQLRGVVFGYACHNTTLPATIYQFHGDYAGFAQARMEKDHPDALAMFVEGCAGDANAHPRGTVELAVQHGETLAAAVESAMDGGRLRAVSGPLKTAFEVVPLKFAAPPSREQLQAQLQQQDVFRKWYAQEMLKRLDREGRLPSEYPYPIQVWQFGRDLTLIALAGEVVVDYALRLKREMGAEGVWVAGYCNDVFAYIPSRRVLEEGGYEGKDAMLYYIQPGPFAPSVEETIIEKVHGMIKQLDG